MLNGGSLSDLFEVVHEPDSDRPWTELEYTNPQDIYKFIDFVNRLNNPSCLNPENAGLLFRGHADSSWTLIPSLWRGLKLLDPGNPDDKKNALRIEYDSIVYFRGRALPVLDSRSVPDEHDPEGWLALMQHYGAPTRLLDWTTFLTVALYFATADHWIEVGEKKRNGPCCRRRENQDGALWFFDHSARRSYMCYERGWRPYPRERYAEILKDAESFVTFGVGPDARPILWPMFPDRPTDRMIAQGSIHLFSETPLCDYASIIGQALLDYHPKGANPSRLGKVVIPADAKPRLREYLHAIGISAATLFPGLDGIGGAIAGIIGAEVRAVAGGRGAH